MVDSSGRLRPARRDSGSHSALWFLLFGMFVLVAFPPALLPAGYAQDGATNGVAESQPAEKQAQPNESAPADQADDSAEHEADSGEADRGMLIRVLLPLTGNSDNLVKSKIRRAMSRLDTEGEKRPILVLELVPGGESEFGTGSDFSRAQSLARFLISSEVTKVKTVAYVPQTIKGHGVLLAMACEEIIMHPEAEIGDAGLDEPAELAIEPAVLSGYSQIARRRRTVPREIALGMLDKQLEVLQIKTEVNPSQFVLREELEEVKQDRVVESEQTLIRPGDLGRFSGREARELGFTKYLARDRQALAGALSLPVSALQEDPSLAGKWQAAQVVIDEMIDGRLVERTKRLIAEELERGELNFVLVRIASEGGSPADSNELANFLAGLDGARVKTVAYVPKKAQADAALIALACDELVMHPDAVLGGTGAYSFAPDQIDPVRKSIRESLAPEKGRSWSLLAAFADPRLKVHRYRHKQTGRVAYFCEDELVEQDDPKQWDKGELVTRDVAAAPEGEQLQQVGFEVTGRRGRELDLVAATVENFDELKQNYDLQQDPRELKLNWANALVEALAKPEFAAMLLVIGGIAVFAELQLPGIGIGGFVATVCFLLFFWSKFLDQTAGWLEVILFAGGMLCLLLEIFVLPGFGVFGLGGGLLILASLVLASQTFVFPTSSQELGELQTSLTVVAAAIVGVAVAGSLMRRYLPHAPMFNRIVLRNLEGEQLAAQQRREQFADLSHLVGETGVTTSRLAPSGKAKIDGKGVNVITQGQFVERGSRVLVVEVRGNMVLVEPVDSA